MAEALDDFSDLTELGIDLDEDDPLTAKFNKCAKHVQSIAGTLDNETLLKLYGFYKQSIEGSCNVPKPSWYDMKGKAKWEAWNILGSMDKTEAKNKYIELVLHTSPDLTFGQTKAQGDSWVKVSSMAHQEFFNEDKSICAYIRSGNIEKVKEYIKANSYRINSLDDSGMGLIHYAADIGSVKILELLIDNGLDINLQDSDRQTALHYASSCGHIDCLKLLLNRGANKNITDSEGFTPADTACDGTVKKLFE